MNELSQLRTLYAELSDRLFTVSNAGIDCYVVTSLSANPFNPMFPIVDVNLVSKEDLMPIKALDQSSAESVLAFAKVKIAVESWQQDSAFPVESDVDAMSEYFGLVGKLNED